MNSVKFFAEHGKAILYDFQGRVVKVAHGVHNYGQAVAALCK